MKSLFTITIILVGILLGICPLAYAGEAQAQASLDFLFAESRDDNPPDFVTSQLNAQELGMRLRLDLTELDKRLGFHLDYRGREPIAGDFQNETLRLLYRAELEFEALKNTLKTAVGRFIAPAALYLPTDGARLTWTPGAWSLMAYGGRRAISLSRRNLSFDNFLPAVGGQLRYARAWIDAEIAATYSEDEGVFIKGSADDSQEVTENYGSSNAYARVNIRPVQSVMLGGQVSFLEQANYLLGPGWNDVQVDVDSVNIWSANFFADWRPIKGTQFDYTFHYQKATAYRAGLISENGDIDADQAPDFLDNRLRLGYRPFNLGWVRLRGRLRVRPDRQEYRVGGSVIVDQLGLTGLYVQGQLLYEDIVFDDDVENPPDLDRLRWSAAAGYRNFGLDAQVGVRLIDRYGARVSGRQADGQSDAIVDLSPFTIGTQRIGFARAFYSQRKYFMGLDWEQNLEDNEFRVFAQIGAFLETSW